MSKITFIISLSQKQSFLTAWSVLTTAQNTGYEQVPGPDHLGSNLPAGFAVYQLCDLG